MRKFIYTIGIIVLAMAFTVIPMKSYAEKDLQEIQDERKGIKKELSAKEREVADVLLNIEAKDSEIKSLDYSLQQNTKTLLKVTEEISTVEEEVTQLENKIAERFTVLKKRAKSYQKNGGNIRYLEVLFGSESFNDFISRLNAVTAITGSDANLIKQQEEDKRQVEMKLADLENLEKELLEIKELVEDQKEKAEQMKSELEEMKVDLTKTVSDLELRDDELRSLENELKIKQSTASTPAFNLNDSGGTLAWPTEGGYISSHMGERWGRMHKGIDIARTDRSTSPPIYAAESGTIETAGTMSGYGKTIIINHGNGLKTLYAHMSSLNVKSGQTVSRGQQIGIMGTTGRSTGIHLHFEVHVNGSIQNPVGYLK